MIGPRRIVLALPCGQRRTLARFDLIGGHRRDLIPRSKPRVPLLIQRFQRTVLSLQRQAERAQGVRAEAVVHRRCERADRQLVAQIVEQRPISHKGTHQLVDIALRRLPEGGVVEAGFAREEALVSGSGISLEIVVVEFLAGVQESELWDQVFCVESEAVFDKGSGVPLPGTLLRGAAHLSQSLKPTGKVFGLAGAPHYDVIHIPAAPILTRQRTSRSDSRFQRFCRKRQRPRFSRRAGRSQQ